MTLTNAQLEADLDEIVADYPQTFTWSSGSYACVAEDATTGRRDEEAGFMDDDDVTIHVQTSLFSSTRPAVGNLVKWNSRSYRIMQIRASSDGLMLALLCKEATA